LATPTREVRRVPGSRRLVVAQPLAIVMADHGGAVAAAGPVAAGAILPGRERGAVRLRAGQDVVPVRAVAAAVDYLAPLVERGLLVEVVVAVQLVDVLRNDHTLRVLPRSAPDAIARINRLAAIGLSAEVGAPGAAARPHRLRELLAVGIGALEPAEV